MAKIFNKIANSFKLDEDYDEFEPDDDFELDYSDDIAKTKYTKSSPSYDTELDLDDYDDEDYQPRKIFKPIKKQSNVVPMKKTSNMEVCMLRPSTLNDAKDVTDTLLSGRAVVINMEGVNLETAQRIIDFVSGSCYSMNGNLQSISRYIFIVTPNNIELSGEFSGALSGGSDSLNVNM